ncbi:hypothetical protein RB195_019883 [Necator americanus]|uniref:Uncharacterized protein n=1 Tax=Necator americanus TaxID=51031 RepID=A0ABR1CHS5_NECAM
MDEMENGNRGTVRQESPCSTEVEDLQDGCASCCPLRMRVLADDESLGKSAARYGDADVEVDDRCNAKVSNDTVRSIFGVVPITEKIKEIEMVWSRLAAGGRFCCQNRSEARRFRSEAAWEAKDSLVRPCEAGYDRCTFVYG